MDKTDLKSLKMAFWFIVIITIVGVASALYVGHEELINLNTNKNVFSNSIFTNGLNFIFSIFAFLIALNIFLVQYIGSKFGAHGLEKFPISRKYFIITPVMLVIFIAFNFISIYLELTFPYSLISLIFSMSIVLLVIATVFLSFYYIDISNIINDISEQTVQFIKKKRSSELLSYGYSDEFINSLNERTSIFVKTSIEAINKDQDKVLRASLDSLNEITCNYLEQSKDTKPYEDKFLDNLNDQFNFIISEGLKSYNQKILEDIAKTIGNISVNIVQYREGTPDIHNFAFNWLATLEDLFLKSYPKDRTIVCNICLEKISEAILLTLDKGCYNSYDSYKMFLDNISQILSKNNHYWSAILLQKALLMYQNQFLKFLELMKTDKAPNNGPFIKSYFDYFADIINNSKKVHSSFGSGAVIFASLYGVDSFAQKIAKVGLTDISNDNKRNVANYIMQLIAFNKKVLDINPEKNDYRIYDSFSEILFLITKRVDLTEEDRELLIETLSNNLLDFVQSEYSKFIKSFKHEIYKLEEATIDYFALLIFLNNSKPDLMKKIIQMFSDIYLNIKKSEGENKASLINQLYKELKLFSCWINIFDELKGINEDIIELLKEDFYEPEFPNMRSIPTLTEKYGYPEINIHGLWYLHPSFMWGHIFQDEIEKKLNGDEGEHYITFHKMLKNLI